MTLRFDLLIRNADIVDGTGAPRFAGDIGIRADRIERVGDLGSASARTEIDLGGGRKNVIAWKPGSLFAAPMNATYRHRASGGGARIVRHGSPDLGRPGRHGAGIYRHTLRHFFSQGRIDGRAAQQAHHRTWRVMGSQCARGTRRRGVARDVRIPKERTRRRRSGLREHRHDSDAFEP